MDDHRSIPRTLFRLTPHLCLWLLFAVALGILATRVTVAMVGAVALGLSFLLGAGMSREVRFRCILVCAAIVLAYGYTLICLSHIEKIRLPLGKSISFLSTVDGIAMVRPDGYAYDLKEIRTGQHFLARLTTPSLHWGDRVQIRGVLRVPDPPGNPGQIDYRRYLTAHGYSATVSVERLTVLRHGWQWPLDKVVLGLREHIVRLHTTLILTPQYQSLFTGLIFGQLAPLDSGLQAQFQKSGLLHVLVASGAQVSLLAGLIALACKWLGISRLLRWSVTFGVIALFCGMSGGGVAIFRASLMAITALTLQLGFRKAHPLHVLALTGLVVLLFSPTSIWDIGAQLSFAATAGLIILCPAVEARLPKRWPAVAKTLIATTLSPYVATLPLLWIHTHTLSVISIFSNLVVLAWLEVMVTVGFFLTLVGLIAAPFSIGIGVFCELALGVLDRLTAWFATFPGGQFYSPSPPIGLALGAYAVLGVGLSQMGQRRKKVIAYGWLSAMIFWFVLAWAWPQSLRVTMLDVGQGDCLVIRTPGHRVVLIDTGGVIRDQKGAHTPIAFRTLLPYLRHEGINRVDILLLSHYHLDHIGGNHALSAEFPIGLVVDRGGPEVAGHDLTLGRQHYCVTESATFQIESGVTVSIRHPAGVNPVGENNHSLVVRLDYGKSRFLFMGDLEGAGEAWLSQDPTFLRADILKVGHHGSKTSSTPEFLRAVQPQLALVSVGKRNLYRHPSAEVMKRLEEIGSQVWRTDQRGAIIVESDGQHIHVGPALDIRPTMAHRLADGIADLVGL